MNRAPVTAFWLAKLILCAPFYVMLVLMVIEALLSAATTYLVIKAGRNVANNQFVLYDLLWIFIAQATAYVIGAISWIFAERAGFLAFGRYMLQFVRDNRHETRLLTERETRERVEPFLTGEAFYVYFHLLYEIEGDLRLLLSLIFNVIVLGTQIDGSLPVAYTIVVLVLFAMQWSMRKRVSRTYFENQRMENRVTAQGYTAWDNVFSGNRYNLRLWTAGFKSRFRDSLAAQIRAIITKEGLSAASAIIGLAIVFSAMGWVAVRNPGNFEVLVALAATLPRQMELTGNVHSFTSGWNDLLAIWARLRGVAGSMRPEADPNFEARIKFDRLILREGDASRTAGSLEEAVGIIFAQPTGRLNVRGANGSGKSTLLTTLKATVKNRAYYWPTADRLAFQFTQGMEPDEIAADTTDEESNTRGAASKRPGFSSGERQIRALREIVQYTDAAMYLLDEWDANLDPNNRATAEALVDELARRARVVEISHRDRV